MTRRLQQLCVMLSAFSLLCVLSSVPAFAQNEAVPDTAETEPNDEKVVVYPENDDENANKQSSATRAKALKRRAGEQVGDDPRGRAAVLGMYVQEADTERVKVVEVTPGSPAFDAGIRKGDEILSFDGFKADSYRKWFDGIRTLVKDSPEGDMIPLVVVRDGKTMQLRLQKPVALADDVRKGNRDALQQAIPLGQPQPQQLPGPQQPSAQPGQAAGGSGGVGIGLAGGVGESGAQPANTNDRGIAEIFRLSATAQPGQGSGATPAGPGVNGLQPPEAGQAGQGGNSTTAVPGAANGSGVGGEQIGLADFSNSATGMVVMLDVGGLEPGNYLVGIDDASMSGGGTPATAQPTESVERRQSELRTPQQSRQVAPPPRQFGPNSGNAPARRQPSNSGGTQPQSYNQPLSHIPETVLAQIIHVAQNDPAAGAAGTPSESETQSIPPTGLADPLDTPPTGQVEPLDTPPSGRIGQPDALPTGQPRQQVNPVNNGSANNSQDPGIGTQGAGIDGATNGTGVGPLITIGTLTVDESGTGRLQQPVEGVQVQHVVGQAIVIYTQQVPATNTLPPDLQTGAEQGSRTGQASGTPNGSPTPVAAGTIRLVSDQTAAEPSGAGTPPSANLPTSGEELR